MTSPPPSGPQVLEDPSPPTSPHRAQDEHKDPQTEVKGSVSKGTVMMEEGEEEQRRESAFRISRFL